MANRQSTPSGAALTALQASLDTLKPRLEAARDKLCKLEDEAHEEVLGLQHLSEMLRIIGEHQNPDDGRLEYVASIVKRHADATSKALSEMRHVAEQMTRKVGGAG